MLSTGLLPRICSFRLIMFPASYTVQYKLAEVDLVDNFLVYLAA